MIKGRATPRIGFLDNYSTKILIYFDLAIYDC
jgi:hypothetical protein